MNYTQNTKFSRLPISKTYQSPSWQITSRGAILIEYQIEGTAMYDLRDYAGYDPERGEINLNGQEEQGQEEQGQEEGKEQKGKEKDKSEDF